MCSSLIVFIFLVSLPEWNKEESVRLEKVSVEFHENPKAPPGLQGKRKRPLKPTNSLNTFKFKFDLDSGKWH